MSVFTALIGATLLVFTYFIVITAKPLLDMFRNRLLYRSYLSRADQAVVEKNLSRLSRVVVMCDRVDPPTLGFLDAVRDNFSTGVRYVFLVSNRATTDELDKYVRVFENIEISARAENKARAELGEIDRCGTEPLFEVHRLRQDWNDYPYICYEFFATDSDESPQYLMYRGNELGVGIASEYVRIPPEIAYSLVKRADALKSYIAAERDNFVDGRAGALENQPAENFFPLGTRSGHENDVRTLQ